MNKRWSIGFYVFAVVLFATWADCATNYSTVGESIDHGWDIVSITIRTSLIPNLLYWASAAVALSLFVLALLGYRWPVVRFPAVAFLLLVVAYPCAWRARWLSSDGFGVWTIYGRIAQPDGGDFVFCDSSFLQGQTMALGRIESESAFGTKIRAFGSTNGDSPRSWASVVRPADPMGGYGQLYLTHDQRLVGVRFENHSYLVFDLANDRFVGREDIEAISPFLCLDADDRLHEPDVEAVRQAIRTTEPGSNGRPHREALEAGLDHPNPAVRALAAEWLELMDDGTSPPPIE